MSRITLILFAAILFFACSSLKQTGKSVYSDIGSNKFDVSKIIELNITNNDFTIQKAEVEIIHEGEKQRLLASLKYKREGIYLLSLRSKTGIEIGRFFLTKDSIIINERIKKKLYFASSTYLLNKYGISISAMPLIFGDFINDGKSDSLFLECKKGMSLTGGYIFKKNIIYSIDCGYKKISSTRVREDNGEENIMFFFNKFEKKENSVFPQQIEIQDLFRNFVIRITIDKIEFKKISEIDFIQGSSYEKVPLK